MKKINNPALAIMNSVEPVEQLEAVPEPKAKAKAPKAKEKLTRRLLVQMTPTEYQEAEQTAQNMGLTISSLTRMLLKQASEKQKQGTGA